ncbi:tyrosine-type recombinase/integrase [Deinococcus sp. UYEF24]
MTIESLWQQFYFHLKVKRRSKTTLVYYGCTERVFGRFLAAQELPQDAEHVTVTHLRAFLGWLHEQGLAVGGVHGHARAIRSVFNWAFREELLTRNPAARLELPSLVRERMPTMTAATVKRLLLSCKTFERPLRDTAIILTLFDTGVRSQELLDIDTDHLLFERGLIRVMGKGSKERFVPIGAKAMQAITVYMRRERHPSHEGVRSVFLSRSGLKLTKSGVGIKLLKVGQATGLERSVCSPHTFRRGFAVEFLRNGGDVFTLQQILGHATLDMTRRYVSFLDEDLKAAHLRFSPGDRL